MWESSILISYEEVRFFWVKYLPSTFIHHFILVKKRVDKKQSSTKKYKQYLFVFLLKNKNKIDPGGQVMMEMLSISKKKKGHR